MTFFMVLHGFVESSSSKLQVLPLASSTTSQTRINSCVFFCAQRYQQSITNFNVFDIKGLFRFSCPLISKVQVFWKRHGIFKGIDASYVTVSHQPALRGCVGDALCCFDSFDCCCQSVVVSRTKSSQKYQFCSWIWKKTESYGRKVWLISVCDRRFRNTG